MFYNIYKIIKIMESIKLTHVSKTENNEGKFVVYNFIEKDDYDYSFDKMIVLSFILLLSVLNIKNNFIFKKLLKSDEKVKFDRSKIDIIFYEKEVTDKSFTSPSRFELGHP